ncbi:hypothetical protein TNCV_2147851 [Trichonephila clavipes]|uniref:Uncharacterized protein n=1 Tax=Trichonephila clavipes TaxID=2585209 RepID=A0A8X6VIL9_TRICX|nr:hypothetical protein TNCV_2147851 [Trichonephila clavipes]
MLSVLTKTTERWRVQTRIPKYHVIEQKRVCGRLRDAPSCRNGSKNLQKTATAGSDVVQSGRPIFDDLFQHLWPYIGNNTANVVFQMVKRLWLIRIDQ